MSSFGGRGRGGRGGSRGGGGRGRGRSTFGGSNPQGGRSTFGSGGDAGQQPRLRPCKNFTSTGSCPNGDNCSFAHVIQLHRSVEASTRLPQQQQAPQHHRYNNNQNRYNNNQYAAVSSVALWENPSPGSIKFFSGSCDGFWRLFDTTQNFAKAFEHNVAVGGGKVNVVTVEHNYMFCGFEAHCTMIPGTKVGMIHVWNLSNPAEPPLELVMDPQYAPYAHAGGVTAFAMVGDTLLSGGHCGVIRTWQFDQATNGGKGGFALRKTLHGHAAEVTGLVTVGGSMLWSSSTDRSIRLWDLASGECKYLITSATNAPNSPAAGAAQNGQPQQPQGVGHTDAVTDLVLFESQAGTFVLSSSLDGTVKAWNSTDGQCMATESHGQGVISLALTTDRQSNPLLLVGLESGDLLIRTLQQMANTPAFCPLLKLSGKFIQGCHSGPVKSIVAGPQHTFYSAGADGKVNVWQITGDFRL